MLLLAAVSIAFILFAAVGVAVVAKGWRAKDLSTVVPGADFAVPKAISHGHSRAARLHRRLRAAAAGARAQAAIHKTSLAPTLDRVALDLDRQLVVADGLAEPHRQSALDQLEVLISEFEARIAESALDTTHSVEFRNTLREIEVELEALRQARAELDQVDHTKSGLSQPGFRQLEDEQDGATS